MKIQIPTLISADTMKDDDQNLTTVKARMTNDVFIFITKKLFLFSCSMLFL